MKRSGVRFPSAPRKPFTNPRPAAWGFVVSAAGRGGGPVAGAIVAAVSPCPRPNVAAVAPLVIAPRTCPRHAVGNSLEGIIAAGSLGAGAGEIDVRPTLDGHAVLMHDRTMRRMTEAHGPTRLRTLAAVRALRLSNGEPVPTFGEALAALPHGLRLAIDVKSTRAADAVVSDISPASGPTSVPTSITIRGANFDIVPSVECRLVQGASSSYQHAAVPPTDPTEPAAGRPR